MSNTRLPRDFAPIQSDLQKAGLSDYTIRALRDVLTRSDKVLTDQGAIQSVAPITGRTEGISTTVGNIDSGGIVTATGADFSRSYTNKNLDNVPNGTRAAWDTGTQKTAAVDSGGNLLLKNIASPAASTGAPTTASAAFVVIPEMTQTITTKGNKVLCVFNGQFSITVGTANIAIFRDAVQISIVTIGSGAGGFSIPLSVLDSPSAASHTYDVRWFTNGGGTITALATNRTFQVVELG